jgi:hypothetical protein
MGCLRTLGCLIVVVIIGVAAFLTRDRWMSKLPWVSSRPDTTVTAIADRWLPLTQAGADRTRDALQKLSTPRGPVFLTLDGSDVASYVFMQIVKQMPASTDSFAARIDGDHIRLRARMRTADLGGAVTGMLGKLLGDRERVEMGGTLRVIGKGRAEFRVDAVKIRDIGLPNPLITRLVRAVASGPRAAGLDENGLPIAIPSYIGDVRVQNGKITLYKNVQ